jgi:hypothetical protein
MYTISAGAQNPTLYELTTDLHQAVQKIRTIVFAIPEKGGTRKSSGRVEMTSQGEKVTVSGSLLTNPQSNSLTSASKVSIFGGKGNSIKIANPSEGESTIIGGSGGQINTSQSFVAGGEANSILQGSRAVILGGKGNSIKGDDAIILGGTHSRVLGNASLVLGQQHTVSGDYAFIAGSGVNFQGSQSFVRNDGSSTFPVKQEHIFSLNATKGMIVNANSPHGVATLTLKGDLRIQPGNDISVCTTSALGVHKTVGSGGKVCPCVCGEKGWQSVLSTTFCGLVCTGV